MQRPSLRQLEYFVRIAEAGTYREAAEQLGMSQPPLTQQMHALEARLGVALFDRTGRRMKLTEAGETLLADARRILGDVDQSCASVRAIDRGTAGVIRIGMTDDFLAGRVVERLAGFLRGNGGIQIDVTVGVSTELLERLESAEVDIVLASPGLPRHHSIAQRALPPSPIRLLVPEDHRLATLRSVPISALAGEAMIVIPQRYQSPFARRCEELFERAGIIPLVAHYAVNEAISAQLARFGCGITLASQGSLFPILDGLCTLDIDDPQASIDHALFYREPCRTPALTRLIDHIAGTG